MHAENEGYCVGAFNFFGLDNLHGIVKAAAERNSPVICMGSSGAIQQMGEKASAYLVKAYAETYQIPVVLHLDHATDFDFICRCIDNGFSSVMVDASSMPFEKNVEFTKRVVEYASRKGCSVEAELGHVGGQEDNISTDEKSALFTDPEDVEKFVSSTGIDALAIAVGTIHGFYRAEPKLDFERIKKIHEITNCPLVLHGGTGVKDEDLKKAIECGIRKINVGTDLKVNGYLKVMKRGCLNIKGDDPRVVATQVREACAEIVKRKIEVFNSFNKAW